MVKKGGIDAKPRALEGRHHAPLYYRRYVTMALAGHLFGSDDARFAP